MLMLGTVVRALTFMVVRCGSPGLDEGEARAQDGVWEKMATDLRSTTDVAGNTESYVLVLC